MKNFLIGIAFLTIPSVAQAAEGPFIYRHYSHGSGAAVVPEPEPEENNTDFELVDVPLLGLSKSNPFMGNNPVIFYGKENFYIGNSKSVAPMFFVRGGAGNLDYSPKSLFSSFDVMPGEALGDLGVDLKGVSFVQASIPLEYGDNISSVNLTFSSGEKTASTNFSIPRQDFQHRPLTMRYDNWPSLIDYPALADQSGWTNNTIIRPRIEIEGGVPPFKILVDDDGVMDTSTTAANRVQLNDANIESDINQSALNAMSQRDENWQPDPKEMVHIFALELSGSGTGNGGCGQTSSSAVEDKTISITVMDADGRTVSSPSLTIRHQPQGMRCLSYGARTSMPESNHLVQFPYLETR